MAGAQPSREGERRQPAVQRIEDDRVQDSHLVQRGAQPMPHQRHPQPVDIRARETCDMGCVEGRVGVVKDHHPPGGGGHRRRVAIGAGIVEIPGGAIARLPGHEGAVERRLRADRHDIGTRTGGRKGAGRVAAHRGAVKDDTLEAGKEALVPQPVEFGPDPGVAIPGPAIGQHAQHRPALFLDELIPPGAAFLALRHGNVEIVEADDQHIGAARDEQEGMRLAFAEEPL